MPQCAYCRKGLFYNKMVMHEALYTRGNVRGNKDLLIAIMVKENCVLVHPGYCDSQSHTKEGRERCLLHLIEYEGENNIIKFLEHMKQLMITDLSTDRLSQIKE